MLGRRRGSKVDGFPPGGGLGQQLGLNGATGLRGNRIHLPPRAVLVVFARKDQYGARDRRQVLFDVPVPECRVEPQRRSSRKTRRPRRRDALRAVRGGRSFRTACASARCSRSNSLQRRRGARASSATDRGFRLGAQSVPAYISAIDPPSLWPIRIGLSMLNRSSSAGSTVSASSCMNCTPRGELGGGDAPWPARL